MRPLISGFIHDNIVIGSFSLETRSLKTWAPLINSKVKALVPLYFGG